MNGPLRVAQIGPWPTPWGGISVYVQRLSRFLASEGDEVVVLDPQQHDLTDVSGARVLPLANGRDQSLRAARAMAAHRCDVAHMHLVGFPWKAVVPFLVASEAVGVPLLLSVHSFRLEDRPPLPVSARLMLRQAARSVPGVFASGEHVAASLITEGVPAHRVEAVAPFVAPSRAEPIDARLPPVLRAHLGRFDHVVSGGAGALKPTADGADLYGFDTFVRVAGKVASARDDVGFIWQLPRVGDEALYSAAMKLAKGLEGRLLIHGEPLEEASDLWAASSIFMRPTRSDGDSVSVREALSLGTPSLASDVVSRPAGTLVFPTEDADRAAHLLLDTLGNLTEARAQAAASPQPRGAQRVREVLHRVGRAPGLRRRGTQSFTRMLP